MEQIHTAYDKTEESKELDSTVTVPDEGLHLKELGKALESDEDKDLEEYQYLVKFRSQHLQFRLPELESLTKLFSGTIKYSKADATKVASTDVDLQSPYLRINVNSEECLHQISTRSVGITAFYKLLAIGKNYEELIENVKKNQSKFNQYCDGTSFKFVIDSFGKSHSAQEQLDIMQQFTFLPLWDTCPVDAKNAKRQFFVMEDIGRPAKKKDEVRIAKRIFFAELLLEANSPLIFKFDVKKRAYIGTTSMDSELALLVANQALARPSALILDPFVGTGSLILTCAGFGAHVLGSDIDPRTIRGSGTGHNVRANFTQFKLEDNLVGLVVCDNAHPPWRDSVMFDAIVADPPYGVREGARKIGKKAKAARRAARRAARDSATPDDQEKKTEKKKEKKKEDEATEARKAELHIPSCVAYPGFFNPLG